VRNFAIGTVALALVGAAAPSDAQQATTKDQFVGTWKVDVLKTTVGDKVSHPLGDRPFGYVTLTADRIWLLFVDPARKPPATPALTDAEAAAMMKTQVSWTGRYVTGEQTPDGVRVGAMISQPELASMIGVAKATGEKALRRLVRAGLARTGYRRITILDRDGLLAITGEG